MGQAAVTGTVAAGVPGRGQEASRLVVVQGGVLLFLCPDLPSGGRVSSRRRVGGYQLRYGRPESTRQDVVDVPHRFGTQGLSLVRRARGGFQQAVQVVKSVVRDFGQLDAADVRLDVQTDLRLVSGHGRPFLSVVAQPLVEPVTQPHVRAGGERARLVVGVPLTECLFGFRLGPVFAPYPEPFLLPCRLVQVEGRTHAPCVGSALARDLHRSPPEPIAALRHVLSCLPGSDATG